MSINLKKSVSNVVNSRVSCNKTPDYIARHHDAPIELIELMVKWGVDIEMEHTTDPVIAEAIVLGNLMEDPVYYKRLT